MSSKRRDGTIQVLFLIDEIDAWGGTERHLFELSCALDRNRFTPSVAVLQGSLMADRFRREGLDLHCLHVRRVLAPAGLVGLGRLTRLLRDQQTDLLVTYHTAADLLGPTAAALTGAATLSSRRDLGFTKKPVHLRLQRRVNSLVAGMIAVSGAVRDSVVATESYPASRIHVIVNGVNASRYSPRGPGARSSLGLAADDLVVGTVANFNPIKGYDVLAAAIERVTAVHPTVRFLLVGDGVQRPQIRARLAPLGWRVLFPGRQDRIAEVLSAMDLFVLASHSEGFSNAIVQAMACGLPVLCTDVGGNREACDDSCGVFVPPADPEALAAAMLKLLHHQSRRQQMAAAALERTRSLFSFERMVGAYQDLFEMTVAEPGSGSPRRRAVKHCLAQTYRLARPLLRQPPRGRAVVLCYHRVLPRPVGYDPAMVVTAETMRQQLEALGHRHRFVPLAELVGELERGGPERHLTAVAFDDGYEDNLLYGLPVLRRLGVPATIFVTTAASDSGIASWFDRVAMCIVSHSRPRVLEALRSQPTLRAPAALAAEQPLAAGLLAREVLAVLEELPDGERRAVVAAIEAALPVDRSLLPRHLSWAQIGELVQAGIEIGSHSVNHPIMTKLSDEELARELDESRRVLRQRTGLAIDGFAYPSGVHDERARRAVHAAGYRYAVSLDPVAYSGDSCCIGRVPVSEQTSRGYAGPFSSHTFVADVEGFLDWFRGEA